MTESNSRNNEEKISFGVLTVTSSRTIHSYFASKLANLQSKTEKQESTSEAVSLTMNDTCNDKHEELEQQALPQKSSGTSPAAGCDRITLKHKQKRRKVKREDGDRCTNDDHANLKSFDSNRKPNKKKKNWRDNNLAEFCTKQ